jgi:MFS family permease
MLDAVVATPSGGTAVTRWSGDRGATPAMRPRGAAQERLPRFGGATVAGAAAFHGWAVVSGAFLVLMVGFGAIYSYAAFAGELSRAFGASHAAVSLTYALSGASCFLCSVVGGTLADRFGPRVVAMGGVACIAAGLLAAAAARELWHIHLCYGLMIGCGVGLSYVPAIAAVQRWFVAKRGLASSIAACGIGVGTALVPPSAALLATFGDWRLAFVISGVLALLVGAFGAAQLVAAPHCLGQQPDGAAAAPPTEAAAAVEEAGPPGRGAFLLAWLGTMLVSACIALPFALLPGTAERLGLRPSDALRLLGLIGVGSLVGRVLLAGIADRLGRRRSFLWCCGLTSASLLIWAVAESLPWLQLFALVFGALQGGVVALLPAFVADAFGSHRLGRTIGLLFSGRAVALVVGPPALAASLEAMSGKLVPIAVLALLGLCGTAMLALARGRGRTG